MLHPNWKLKVHDNWHDSPKQTKDQSLTNYLDMMYHHKSLTVILEAILEDACDIPVWQIG